MPHSYVAVNIPIEKKWIWSRTVDAVDARIVHAFVGSKRQFGNWVKAKVVNNPFFEEHVDYILLAKSGEQNGNGHGGHNRKDYALPRQVLNILGRQL